MLLGMLQRISIHGVQMRLAKSRNAVFTLQQGIKHGPAILETIGHNRAAATARHPYFDLSWHNDFKRRLTAKS